ncbi:MAG TPA: NAD(+)/NADH kinase [Firmicutes bacterium]|nr:NAD(+)/NADH kinase [Bacillota bacterium]
MRVVLIPNEKAAGVPSAVGPVREALTRLGAKVLLPPDGLAFPGNADEGLLSSGDLVIVLGGDGTIIHTAKRAAPLGKAVLGINCGTLGFMAGLESDELERLSALIGGRFTVEKRMMLSVQVCPAAGVPVEYQALNEAVLARGPQSRMVKIAVSSGEEPVATYNADGVIVATPTGSTAYSLSAGGPIVDPAVDCLLLTPVCPHSLYARSYIFSAAARLTLRPEESRGEAAYLTVDGEESVRIYLGDAVQISRSAYPASLIRLKEQPFYQTLHQKLTSRR